MGESILLKMRHGALFPACHSFQANGIFQVGTAGGSEHTACRQPLAGVGNHTWTKQIKTGEIKTVSQSEGGEKLLKYGWGSQVVSLASLDLLSAARGH